METIMKAHKKKVENGLNYLSTGRFSQEVFVAFLFLNRIMEDLITEKIHVGGVSFFFFGGGGGAGERGGFKKNKTTPG